jgi:hypothetical protein
MPSPPSRPARTPLAIAPVALAAVLLAACGPAGTGAPASPSPDAPGATAAATSPTTAACAPAVDPGPGGYPGWPVPGQAQEAAAIPIVVSSERVVGPNRFLFAIVDEASRPLAAPDVAVEARFFDLSADPARPVAVVGAAYLDPGNGRGLYRAAVDFPCPGPWGLELAVRLPDGETTPRTIFEVHESSATPAIGAPAPRSESLTAETPEELAAISTDREPDPDLYRVTIAEAVTSGRPSVVFFATPAFCQTATCGPALDRLKAVAGDYRERVTFVNVEPFELHMTPNGPQPLLSAEGQVQPVAAVLEWGIRVEPYLFVVDADGNVAAKLEGAFDEAELRTALDETLTTTG